MKFNSRKIILASMIANLATASARALLDTYRKRETADDIESTLNQHLADEMRMVKGHDGEQIELRIESVSVRPKYRKRQVEGGVYTGEINTVFDSYSEDRESATTLERFLALLNDRWITVVRLELVTGDVGDLEPHGGDLSYMTGRRALLYEGYSEGDRLPPTIRVADTHEMQSDKLEIKIPFHGSVGEYRSRVADALDLLEDIQSNMKERMTLLLQELYQSNRFKSDGEFKWRDEERAQQIGEFVLDEPVDPDLLAATLSISIETVSDSGGKSGN